MFGKDVRFENVQQAAIIISNENNVYTQIGFANAVARNTPVFARFRDSGRTVNGKGSSYRVGSFSYGLTVPAAGQLGHFDTSADIDSISSLPAPKPLAIRDLPPVSQWANAHELGVVGDGQADDTAALQRAIDSHRVVYLPLGAYKVTDTIHLGKNSVLIALHPALTQIVLADGTPAYQGVGPPKAVVQSAEGGDAIVSGVGVYTGGVNVRAVALMWMRWREFARRRRQVRAGPRHVAGQRNAIQQIQLQPLGRAGSGPALGRPISQPVGDERRRWYVQRHLEPGYLRERRPLCVQHHDAGARL